MSRTRFTFLYWLTLASVLSTRLIAQTVTSVSLASAPNPSTFGTAVTVTASVTPSGVTGKVTFYDGPVALGVSALSGGRAVLTTYFAQGGAHSLHARYSGDSQHAPTDSPAITQNSTGPSVHTGIGITTAGSATGPYLITTLAGSAPPATPLPGTSAVLWQPGSVAVDTSGNVFFADQDSHMVFKLDPTGSLWRVAGTGQPGYSGDNGPATSARLYSPSGVAVDAAGSVYIADKNNSYIRKVLSSGVITTVASVVTPTGLAVDGSGNLYVAEFSTSRIRKLTPSGVLSTVAGTGTAGYSGDSITATTAQLNQPNAVAVDSAGNLFIADTWNHRIREVSTAGMITTVAGNGGEAQSCNSGFATGVDVSAPTGVAVDNAGNIYIANSNCVREVTGTSIALIAGSTTAGFSGDGGSPLNATFSVPYALAWTGGRLFVADFGNQRIRAISSGTVNTVAGSGAGDAGASPRSTLHQPNSVVRDSAGNIYVSDSQAHRVHKITAAGSISTVAGTGIAGYTGDSGPAASAQLNSPSGLAVDSNGVLYIADSGNNCVRKLADGTITTVAGTGAPGYNGDNMLATNAQLWTPQGVAVDPQGNLYISEVFNYRVRKVTPGGTISTVAGNGNPGYSGDNTLAINASLNSPGKIAVDASGNLYITDPSGNRIRQVDSGGTIRTIAGTGAAGFSGDGALATAAQLNNPTDIAVDASGNLYIADMDNTRIRLITTNKLISTIAGQGSFGTSGDGGPATNATLWAPDGVAAGADGNVYIADRDGHNIRVLTRESVSAQLSLSLSHNGTFPVGGSGQYTLTVSNAALSASTVGTVTVTETLPEGLSLAAMSGIGWSCDSLTCTRSDTLAAGASYSEISVIVSVSPTADSQATNMAAVSGGGSPIAAAEDLTVMSVPTTIQTNPAGMQVSIDGVTMNAPQTLNLTYGNHILTAPSPQASAPGKQYAFTAWSDSGAISHPIAVYETPATYTASFKTQYQLTATANPAPGGTVTPASGTFFDAGTSINLTATPNSPYTFTSWSGDASGTSNPLSITMDSTKSVTAGFLVPGFTCDINNDTKTNVMDVQLIITAVLNGTYSTTLDLNHDGKVDISDVQKLRAVVLGGACLY